jgi:hypothetical protein
MDMTKNKVTFSDEERKEIFNIELEDARGLLKRGLKHFVGDDAQWAPEYDEIAEWLTNNKHKGLLCFGKCGRGKSLICEKIMPVIFRYYLHKNLIKFDGYEINDNRSLLRECDCAILIDDFGVENISKEYGNTNCVFTELVYLAEKRQQLLILTTNLSLKEIGQKYGERTLDRLRCLTHPVMFTGKSFRK